MQHAATLQAQLGLDPQLPVWVYGDGSGKGWSIAQNYRRICELPQLLLQDVRFVVQRRVRALAPQGGRNFHAFAEGWLDVCPEVIPKGNVIRYHPNVEFYTGDAVDRPICTAGAVYFDVHCPWGVDLGFGPAIDPGGEPISNLAT